MHDIQSPAFLTELMFAHFDGVIEDHGEYLCIKTPSNPDFMWGNYLLFREAPTQDCYEKWTSLYQKHFPNQNWYKTFGWDKNLSDQKILAPFLNKKFVFDETQILIAKSSIIPKTLRDDIVVHPASTPQEWEFITNRHIEYLCSGPHQAEQEAFERSRFKSYEKISNLGHGNWFIAYKNDEPVGDMGIFHQHRRARFQEVLTYPKHRKQGVCRSMSYWASQFAFDHYPISSIITLTDVDDAFSAYTSIGFENAGTAQSLRWYDTKLR